MNNGINLLKEKEDVGLKEKKRIKLLKTISVISLGITALTIIVLLIFYSQLKISSIKKDQETTIRNMSLLREKSAKFVTVSDRIAIATEVLSKRKDYQWIVSEITKQLPEKMTISGMSLDKTGINMRISSTSLYSCKLFIDRMIVLAEKKEVLNGLTIESFVYDVKNNKYSLVLNSNLP